MRDMGQRSQRIHSIIVMLSVLSCGVALALNAPVASAEQHHEYSLASLWGDYAVVNSYGASLALGVGTEQFDGAGRLHGTLLLNRPNASGGRDLVPLTSTGTYTVNKDGTGTILLEVTLPDGTVKTATEDFVITRVERTWGPFVATEIMAEQREQSLVLGNGVFVTEHYTRRAEIPKD
jgi:hypothetical protein